MDNVIIKLIANLYNEVVSLNYYIINILSYINFFKKLLKTKQYEPKTVETELTKYIEDFNLKNKFVMQQLKNDDLEFIGDMFINLDTYDVDYLQLLMNAFNLKKELKPYAKELKSLYTNDTVSDYIVNIIGPTNQYERILNLFSGTGSFIKKIIKNNKKNKNAQEIPLFGYEINDELNIIASLLINLETDTDYSEKIIRCDLIKDEIPIEKSDIIVANLPSDIKNLTHASCCNRIKQLKIRGTKSEPLIIQLITTLLKKNGKAILKIPDSFLFGESNQHIETRKYLISNYCVEQIITIPNFKKSILIFSNKKPEKQIKFTDIDNTYELNLPINTISDKSFSLYYPNYHMSLKNEKNISTKKGLYKINDIINISNIDTDISKINKEETILISCKNNTLKITSLNQISQYDINNKFLVYTTKNSEIYPQEFLNYHLFEFLSNNIKYITKGKCKTIDIDTILNLDIQIPDIKSQKNCLNYNNLNGSILVQLQQQITELEQMKNNLIKSTIMDKKTSMLSEFCNISNESKEINTIQINRNSNMAGKVSRSTNDTDNSTNIYYLNIIENKINSDVLYYILKYYEKNIIELSNVNNTIQLPRNKLEEIKIAILTKDEENEIIKCIIIDEKIKKINQIFQDLLSESMISFF